MLEIHGKSTASTTSLREACGDIRLGLRWGGPFRPGAVNGEVHLLNGLEQLQALQAANVACPEFVTDPNTINYNTDIWLARKLNHTQGKDIIQAGQRFYRRRAWNNSDFYTKYIESQREWRLHIIKFARGYRCIGRSLKCFQYNPTSIPDIVIRSRRLGWHMQHDIEPPKGLRSIAKAACEAVGYELGAVDILETGDTAQPFVVLEVNSRPALRDNYTISAYAKALQQLATERN